MRKGKELRQCGEKWHGGLSVEVRDSILTSSDKKSSKWNVIELDG